MNQTPESATQEELDAIDQSVDAFGSTDDILAQEDVVEEQQLKYRLPFGFAKRNSVLVQEQESGFEVYCLAQTAPEVLNEVRRVLKQSFSIHSLAEDEFEAMLTQAYQRDSSEAQQMMEDIGNEVDLYSLADEVGVQFLKK